MTAPLTLLILEDQPADAELEIATLAEAGFDCTFTRVETRSAFESALRAGGFDAVIADYTLPSFDGLSALEIYRSGTCEAPFIFVSGSVGEEIAIEAVKAGATDYVMKDRMARLGPAMKRALAERDAAIERRRLAASLDQRNRLLGRLFDVSPLCIKILDTDFRILEINRHGLALIGTSRAEDARSRSIFDFILDEYRETIERQLREVLAGQLRRFEFEVISPAGKRLWQLCDAVPLTDERGTTTSLLMITADITDQKNTESALRRSEELYRILTEISPHVVWMSDSHGSVQFLNRYWFNLTGMSFEDSAGEGWASALHPEDRERALGAWAQSIAYGTEFSIEARLFSFAERIYRWHLLRTVPMRQDSGTVTGWIGTATDVHAAKTAAQAVAASEQRLRAVLDHTTATIFIKDLAGRYVLTGRQTEVVLRRKEQDIVGKTDAEVFPPEFAATFAAHDRTVLAAGEPMTFEESTPVGDEIRSFVSVKVPLRDPHGQIYGLCGIATDVTDLKRVERAARLSDERLFGTLHNTPGVAVQWFDKAGQVLYWNPASERLYGYSSSEALGKTLDQLIQTPEDTKAFLHVVRQIALSNHPVGPAEATVRRKDGSASNVLYTLFTIPGSDGEPIFVRMDVDITHQKLAEAALAESKTKLEYFIEYAPAAIAMFDPEMRYLAASRRWRTDYKLGDQPLVGRSHYEVFPDIPERWKQVHRRCLAGAIEHHEGDLFVRADGSRLWLRWEVRPWHDSSGGIGGLVLATVDITRDRLLEEQLRRTQTLESIGRLAGGVAHDFNNLLTVVLGALEMAEAKIGPASAAASEVAQIRAAAERATDLTRQLLTFARKQVVEPQVIDVRASVRQMASLLTRLLREDIKLRVTPEENLWHVLIDPGQFEQVILNLAINARDAMPDGGTLTILAANASVGPEYAEAAGGLPAGEYIVLTVSDTGVGMDSAVLERAFEPFFTTKQFGKGTGLGLATVHGIVEQAGGFIRLESQLGEGTTVKVYLPRTTRTPTTHAAPDRARVRRSGEGTILLVEDEPMVRQVAASMLRSFGYTVLEAGEAEQAIEIARGHTGTIELLLTDVVLPGKSGSQLAQEAALIRPDMKVLYSSGHTEDAIVRTGVASHDLHFLQKPYSPAALANKIEQVLGRAAAELPSQS